MVETLKIINYPDPRLKKASAPVAGFDDDLKSLANRMFELMRQAKGVGLAAPQVGQNLRLFVANHSGQPEDDRVFVNPTLTLLDGEELVAEEGCLSLPDIHIDVLRSANARIDAFDLEGNPFTLEREGFEARVWQHEFDHLLGILLTDRMSFTDKMKHRKRLKELEAKAKP
jgi:peptide deformylase